MDFPREGYVSKHELLAHLQRNGRASACLQEVIRYYGRGRSRTLDLTHLREDLGQSIRALVFFHSLGSRGFSYSYWEDIELDGDPLRRNINLRVALMPEEELFYPRRVKRYLRRTRNNHFQAGGFPSIAFALGSIEGGDCYVLVLQSDIAYRQPAYIRDHFRGWRKIFVSLIESSVREQCTRLWLCRSCDVVKCCHPLFRPKNDLIPLWETIYDRTALELGFVATSRGSPIDLQVYEDLPPVLAQELYMKRIG
jgi:hypothetical protein